MFYDCTMNKSHYYVIDSLHTLKEPLIKRKNAYHTWNNSTFHLIYSIIIIFIFTLLLFTF